MNILNKLTLKHLKLNKKRTVVTIIGVMLSTALMVGIGLLLSTLRDNSIKEVIYSQGSQHVTFYNIEGNKKDFILKNNEVKNAKVTSLLGYALLENGTNEYKPYLKVIKTDSQYLEGLQLLEGNLPRNENEIVISNHIESNGGISYKIGDKITLEIGTRYFKGEEIPNTDDWFQEGEELKNTVKKEYTIVGIVNRNNLENYSDAGYSVFTKGDFIDKDNVTILVEYKKVKNTYAITENITNSLGYSQQEALIKARYNDSLLALYGISNYGNMLSSMTGILAIMLILVSVACIIVIYNSFAISVMERKKQFGLFASIGTTRRQIRKTVFFEALIIGIIGIPLGVLASYIGIGTVIAVINWLLPNVFHFPLALATYSVFLIIPIIFMIVVILASAFIPARSASKVTPIEAIRQNDDIKIKGKIKNRKWVRRIFKVEGEIAHKNMQRNKRKYRITIASLVISIVLFISFSAFMEYMIEGSDIYTDLPDYDLVLNYSDNSSKNVEEIKNILKHDQVEEYFMMDIYRSNTNSDFNSIYTKEFKDAVVLGNGQSIQFVVLDNETFDNYLKQIGQTEIKPILYNRYQAIQYNDNERKAYDITKYNNTKTPIALCDMKYSGEDKEESTETIYDCQKEIKDYYLSEQYFLGSYDFSHYATPTIIVRQSEIEKYLTEGTSIGNSIAYVKASKYDKLDTHIKEKIDDKTIEATYYNIKDQTKLMQNMLLVVQILVYGFISLVTLIGVTSVFNTINTSIALRRKEFAMLRSIGLTPKGFNKIIRFESLFVGLKALIIALPISLGVTVLLFLSVRSSIVMDLLIPWKSIIIAVVGVFIIILLTMSYAVSKIKKENILDAIREENI